MYNGKDKNLVGLTLFKGKTRAGQVSCCWRPERVSRLSLSRCWNGMLLDSFWFLGEDLLLLRSRKRQITLATSPRQSLPVVRKPEARSTDLRKAQAFLCCLSWKTSYPSLFSILQPTLLIFAWSDLRCLWDQSGDVKRIRHFPFSYFTFLKLTRSTSPQSELNWLHKACLELVYGSGPPLEFGLLIVPAWHPICGQRFCHGPSS